ncbi:disease resistance RPP13-like protein 4 [Corylus avellana]|uniref:disease resistance RPP13-like protein 4 n=1 Tax=Corylus avellana TaxID=13451 RepID=UPI00286A56ED|nr:disease resistance RPP13-like protein 4 [Corylus avellana]
MSKQTSSPNSSFEHLDLLSFLKSGRTTPFHIFIDFVIPQFLGQLSKRKQHLLNSTQKEDSGLQERFDKIEKKLSDMENACGTLKEWEDKVNKEFKDLILKNLDDAFKERTEALENCRGIEILEERLEGAWNVVSMLTNGFSSGNLESRSVKPSRFAKKLKLDFRNMIAESSILKEIQVVYDGLEDESKRSCLLCFSVFPQNVVIKRKALVHWWVGEKLLSSQTCGDKTDEEKGNNLFAEFIAKGIIESVSKKRRPSSALCKMHPLIRYAVIQLAETNNFIRFHTNGNPTADFSDKKNKRGFLVTTEEGSSELRELTYGFRLKQENVGTLFNVNEPYVDLREHSLSEMTNMRVLQLGRFQDQVKQADAVKVFDTEFLKGLKKMKHLRYLSLRGITRVRELPDSICKLTKLIIVDLHDCQYLEKLPEGIGSLTNLTRLDMSGCNFIRHMPVGLAKLLKLQVLHGFWIGTQAALHDGQDFCKLATLARKLKCLTKLSINVDERCTDKGLLAKELNSLSEFESLASLSVAWSDIHKNDGEGGRSEEKVNGPTTPGDKQTTSHSKQTTSDGREMTSVDKQMTSGGENTTKPPDSTSRSASLAKLELQFYPDPEMPDWVKLFNLEKLKKLYVRGGKLSKLEELVGCKKWKVSILRLELLSELQMDWGKLQALFPQLRYVQKIKCPKLILFPCDENGEWVSGESDTGEISEEKPDSSSSPPKGGINYLKSICNFITFRRIQ